MTSMSPGMVSWYVSIMTVSTLVSAWISEEDLLFLAGRLFMIKMAQPHNPPTVHQVQRMLDLVTVQLVVVWT